MQRCWDEGFPVLRGKWNSWNNCSRCTGVCVAQRVHCLLCTCGGYPTATVVLVCRVNKTQLCIHLSLLSWRCFQKPWRMLLVFATTSFNFAGGSKVAEIYVALWHPNCMWLFHSRISQNNMCCLSSNMITALSPYISIRPEHPPLLVPGTYISNSVRPGKKTLETTMLRGQVGWLQRQLHAERTSRESHLKFNHKYMMYFATCTDLTRECHGANSEQLDVCGLTTSNSWTHDEWPMVKVHILSMGKHSLSCCSSVVMFCGTRKFPCAVNVCFPATVKRKL